MSSEIGEVWGFRSFSWKMCVFQVYVPPLALRLCLVGGFKHDWIMFHFIYGMSSETHWLSLHHFFKMGTLHHQPVLLSHYYPIIIHIKAILKPYKTIFFKMVIAPPTSCATVMPFSSDAALKVPNWSWNITPTLHCLKLSLATNRPVSRFGTFGTWKSYANAIIMIIECHHKCHHRKSYRMWILMFGLYIIWYI